MALPTRKPQSAFLLSTIGYDRIYGPQERAVIAELTDMASPVMTAETYREHRETCRQVELLFSGWGIPIVDESFLETFPRLKTIFYGAGSIKGFATEAMWERGISVTSANQVNAIPVCEFTLAQIILCSKHVWQLSEETHRCRTHPSTYGREPPGMYGSVIGLISLGSIGRMVAERLRSFDVEVIAYDPFFKQAEAEKFGVKLCSLQEVFTRSDVVSCHAPLMKETEGMIRYEHFAAMKPEATFINTARGAVVDESALISAFQERSDIYALLDVTWPEPPMANSRLYRLPNVRLTPHVAGSIGRECHRMGAEMVHELRNYLSGRPLQSQVTREQAVVMA